jgi:hypothetical protein
MRAAVATLVLVLSVWWFWPTSHSRLPSKVAAQPDPAEGPLHVDPAELHFGDAFESKTFRWVLTIRNTSSEPVLVSRFDPGCDCASTEPQSATIQPAGEQRLALVIDLSRKQAISVPAVRQVEYPIAAVTADGRVRRWKITGRVKPLVAVEMPATLEADLRRDSQAPTWTLRVRPLVGVSRVELADSRGLVVTELGHDGRAYVLTCRPDVKKAGLIRGVLVLDLADTDGNQLPSQTIPLPFIVRERAQAMPERLDFGATPVGVIREEMLLLSSPFQNEAGSWAAESDSDCLVVQRVAGSENQARWMARLKPTAVGHASATIRWRLRDDAGEFDVVVPVTWYGTRGR